jgi:hypothetical protein
MQRHDGFRRHGYRAATGLLLTATFVGLVGKFWAAAAIVILAMALVAAVEGINDAITRRTARAPLLLAVSGTSGA